MLFSSYENPVKCNLLTSNRLVNYCFGLTFFFSSTFVLFLSVFFFSTEYGLAGYYANDKDVAVICWRYMALPLLPANEVVPQLRRIRREIRETVKDKSARNLLRTFHNKYIVQYWVLKVRPARFSVFGCKHRTNNAVESLHKKMKANMPCGQGNTTLLLRL